MGCSPPVLVRCNIQLFHLHITWQLVDHNLFVLLGSCRLWP